MALCKMIYCSVRFDGRILIRNIIHSIDRPVPLVTTYLHWLNLHSLISKFISSTTVI
jgi:hypothetical protein